MAAEAANDLELQLKKRARRRLVGAIALVLLMVIVLPIVLRDRSAEQAKPEVTITIPNEIKPTQQENANPSNALPKEESKTATSEEVGNTDQNDADIPVSVTKPTVKTEAKPTETKIIEKKLEAKKPELNKIDELKASTKFYVQIGVFSDADNVKKLQTKLTELGYQSQTEKISTDKGEKIRLRTSIFKERNEAAIALENIKSSGMAGIVVSQK